MFFGEELLIFSAFYAIGLLSFDSVEVHSRSGKTSLRNWLDNLIVVLGINEFADFASKVSHPNSMTANYWLSISCQLE